MRLAFHQFFSFYGIFYCLKERASIVCKTKVRNHRRVTSSPEREIQKSSEAMSVKNQAFVGEGGVMIVGHFYSRGVGWGSL